MGLPERLLALRKNANISQKKLAKEIGVSQASIGYWEKGQRTPSIDAVKKIAKYFHVSTSYLAGQDSPLVLNPGDIVLDVTEENFKKYPMYFNAVYEGIVESFFIEEEARTLDIKSGRALSKNDFEEILNNLSEDKRLKIMQSTIDKIVVNPILETVSFYTREDLYNLFYPDAPPQE